MMNFVARRERGGEDTSDKVCVECLRCGTPMWVCPFALTVIDRGARPFCDVCSRIEEVIAQGAGIVVITEGQLDVLLGEMEREHEIVRSN